VFFPVVSYSAAAELCDPDTWTYQTATDTNSWVAICVAFDLFVAIANEGGTGQDTAHLIMSSPTGATGDWTERATTTSGSLNADEWTDICTNGSRAVACAEDGGDGRIIYADSVTTWNYVTDADTSRTAWQGICWTGTNFVAVGIFNSSADTIYSTNAEDNTWTHVDSGIEHGVGWRAIDSDGSGNVVAVGTHASPSGLTLVRYSSNDGVSWTGTTSGVPENAWRDVHWCDFLSLWIAVSNTGTGNRVMTSSNMSSWTAQTSAGDEAWEGITSGDGVIVVVGDSDKIMISYDAITWELRDAAGDNDWRDVAYRSGIGFTAINTNSVSVTERVMIAVC